MSLPSDTSLALLRIVRDSVKPDGASVALRYCLTHQRPIRDTSMHSMLGRMKGEGLVTSEVCADDKRRKLYTITPKGRRVLEIADMLNGINP